MCSASLQVYKTPHVTVAMAWRQPDQSSEGRGTGNNDPQKNQNVQQQPLPAYLLTLPCGSM